MGEVLRIENLRVRLPMREQTVHAVNGVSLTLRAGCLLALVGESGCGKSMTARAVLRLLPPYAQVEGHVWFGKRDLLRLPARELRHIRGREVAMIYQNAPASLTPWLTVRSHLRESLRAHPSAAPGAWRDRAIAALQRAGIVQPERLWGSYPFQLSGGQQQRVALALATVLGPSVLLADEITTALDVTTQAKVLDELRALALADGWSVLLITHDLAVAAHWADNVAVMLDGRIVESGTVREVILAPQHPYTARMLACQPRLRGARWECGQPRSPRGGARRAPGGAQLSRESLIAAVGLVRRYRGPEGRQISALDGVTLEILPGESVAVVGESGSGKSTLVRCLAALERPDRGSVRWDGADVWALPPEALRQRRRHIQVIFQDSLASFNPRFTVAGIVGEPLKNFVQGRAGEPGSQVRALLRRVGLGEEFLDRFPHQLSGGQQQRVAIARALALRPRLLLCDEPLSGLDVSIQAEIRSLLRALRQEEGLSLLFVTHNLALVPSVADRVLVMHRGRVVEALSTSSLEQALDPYTRALLDAVPDVEALHFQRSERLDEEGGQHGGR